MSRLELRNLVVGLFVLAGLAGLAFLSVDVGGLELGGGSRLRLFVHFDEIGGLRPQSPVQVAGVKVGEVVGITLDDDYRAMVELELDDSFEYPIDTVASIVTAGILGSKLISLQIGGDVEMLADGDTIDFTESAVILERLIGKLIHNTSIGDEE
jgi:phospholipid/cholesterol/gamma-HCH transport system substrate-binding protein